MLIGFDVVVLQELYAKYQLLLFVFSHWYDRIAESDISTNHGVGLRNTRSYNEWVTLFLILCLCM